MKIGLTGSIGVGKTEVFKYIQKKFGDFAEYIDADDITHELYEKDEVKKFLKKEFGTSIRKEIGNIVFSNKGKLIKLNSYMHKKIVDEIKEKIKNSKQKYIFVDIPLLYELKLEYLFDKVIVVYADKSTQIKRIIMRNNLSSEEAIKRVNSQIDIEEKRRLADYVIENMTTLDNLYINCDKIFEKIRKEK